jgi:hypothetical protein
LKPSPGATAEAGFNRPESLIDQRIDDGFHAWHFFVLASILLATVTVFLSRRSSPSHLILLSLSIAAAGAVAAALYRMLLPLVSADLAVLDEPMTGRRRATLERDKMLALRAIKELEFDRAMGKLSQKDFDEMSTRLRQRAVVLMKQLDAGGGYQSEIEKELQARLKGRQDSTTPARQRATGACACGTVNDTDAVFCKKCGTRLQAA